MEIHEGKGSPRDIMKSRNCPISTNHNKTSDGETHKLEITSTYFPTMYKSKLSTILSLTPTISYSDFFL